MTATVEAKPVCPKCGAPVDERARRCKCGQVLIPSYDYGDSPMSSEATGGEPKPDPVIVKPPDPMPVPQPPPVETAPAPADEPLPNRSEPEPAPDVETAPAPVPGPVENAPTPAPDPVPVETRPAPSPIPVPREIPSGDVASRIGLHLERTWVAVAIALAVGLVGAFLLGTFGAAPLATGFGIFAAAIALWAPSVRAAVVGVGVLVVGIVVMRSHPEIGLVIVGAALAVSTAPGRGLAAWFAHAAGLGLALGIAYKFLGHLEPEGVAVGAICAVAIVGLVVSNRAAR